MPAALRTARLRSSLGRSNLYAHAPQNNVEPRALKGPAASATARPSARTWPVRKPLACWDKPPSWTVARPISKAVTYFMRLLSNITFLIAVLAAAACGGRTPIQPDPPPGPKLELACQTG